MLNAPLRTIDVRKGEQVIATATFPQFTSIQDLIYFLKYCCNEMNEREKSCLLNSINAGMKIETMNCARVLEQPVEFLDAQHINRRYSRGGE